MVSCRASLLEVHYLVCLAHLFVEKLHVGQFAGVVFIHAVDVHTFASGYEHALAQCEKFGLLGYGKQVAVAVGQVDRRAIQVDGHLFSRIKEEVAESNRIPFYFRISG